jgi:hypothetical protein
MPISRDRAPTGAIVHCGVAAVGMVDWSGSGVELLKYPFFSTRILAHPQISAILAGAIYKSYWVLSTVTAVSEPFNGIKVITILLSTTYCIAGFWRANCFYYAKKPVRAHNWQSLYRISGNETAYILREFYTRPEWFPAPENSGFLWAIRK